MIASLACALISIAIAELALSLPFATPLRAVSAASGRSMRAISRSSASDHWKQRILLAMAGRSLRAAAMLAFYLGLVACAAAALVAGGAQFVQGFAGFMIGGTGVTLSLVVALAYAGIRLRVRRARL